MTVFGPCPVLAAGTRLRGYFQRCCEVLVVEERVVQGLGAPAAAPAHAPGALTLLGRRTSDSGSSFSYSGSYGGGSYTHCYEVHMQGAGAGSVPEGYTCGGVLGSSIHPFYGSCPPAAAQLVQRCLRVDVAATSAAAAQAARAAQAAAGAAALCDSPSGARHGLPMRSTSAGSDAQSSSPSASCTTPPPGVKGLPWRHMHAKSTPDLLRYSNDPAGLGSDAGSEVLGYWQSAGSSAAAPPPYSRRSLPQQHQMSQQQHHQHQQQHQAAAGPPNGLEGQQRQLRSLKSMSIPANMHRMAHEQQQQQQQQQLSTSGPQPFAVPKRWSMELQRLGSQITQHVLSSSGGRQGDSSRPAGRGPAANPLHRRTGSYGSHGRLNVVLDSDLEPLPEAAAQALASHFPATGRAHSKMIGLACPLGALAADGGLGVTQLPGRGFGGGGSTGTLSAQFAAQQLAQAQAQLQQQQAHALLQQQLRSPDAALSSSPRCCERSDGSDSASGSNAPSAAIEAAWQQQQQQQQQQQHAYQNINLYHQQQHAGAGPSMSRKSSASHELHAQATWPPHAEPLRAPPSPPPQLALSRVPSAHAALHRRNPSSACSLPARPGRGDTVVSLSPSATATLVALGLGPRLAGVTDACRVCGAGGGDDALPDVVCYAAEAGGSSGGSSGGRRPLKIDADAIRRIRPSLVVVPRSGGGGDEGEGGGGGGAPDRAAVQKALERSGVLWPESGAVVLYQRCFTLAEVGFASLGGRGRGRRCPPQIGAALLGSVVVGCCAIYLLPRMSQENHPTNPSSSPPPSRPL